MSKNQIIILLSVIIIILLIVGYVEVVNKKCPTVCEQKNSEAITVDQTKPQTETVIDQQTTQTNENPMELQIETLTAGTGDKQIVAGETAVVHYTGWFTDGTKFDSSVDRGTPFEFKIGVGQVIPGWDQGVLGMKVGEKRKLTIPSNLAYGDTGVPGAIPAKATLIFEVELMAIK